MVKRNIPDWQRSAFDKDNNSCVKTKPFSKRIKEFEVAMQLPQPFHQLRLNYQLEFYKKLLNELSLI